MLYFVLMYHVNSVYSLCDFSLTRYKRSMNGFRNEAIVEPLLVVGPSGSLYKTNFTKTPMWKPKLKFYLIITVKSSVVASSCKNM